MNTELQERNSEELLRQLLVYQKKEVRLTRFAAFFNILLVAGVLAALLLVVPRVLKLAGEMESSLAEVRSMTASAQVLIGNTNTMLTENNDAISETISDLNDAIRPLAELARKLG